MLIYILCKQAAVILTEAKTTELYHTNFYKPKTEYKRKIYKRHVYCSNKTGLIVGKRISFGVF